MNVRFNLLSLFRKIFVISFLSLISQSSVFAEPFLIPGFFGVESVLGEAEAAAEKDHALGRSGRGGLGAGEAFQKGKCQDGAAETKKGSAGGGVGMERHRVREFSREIEVTVLA